MPGPSPMLGARTETGFCWYNKDIAHGVVEATQIVSSNRATPTKTDPGRIQEEGKEGPRVPRSQNFDS